MTRAAGVALTLLLSGRPAAADEARLLDQSGSGIVTVNDEKIVHVRGVEGEVILQTGAARNVEFSSASMAKAGGEIPLAITTDGAEIGLQPPGGQASVKTLLRLVVPAGMGVLLEVDNTSVLPRQIDAELTVRGSHVRVDAVGLKRRAKLEITGGSVAVQGAVEGLSLKARDVEVVLDGVSGPAALTMTGGSAKLTGLQAGLKGEFVRTRVNVNTISGGVDLRFQEGRAQLTGLRDGGQISATGCLLAFNLAGGDLTITSDSEVQFIDSRASFHIENTAGGVTGARNDGLVDITTHKAAVSLAQINGQLRVAGDELDVKLENIGAATVIRTRSSNVAIEGTATVSVENDRGNVVVKRSEALIEVKSRDGDVHLLEMRGPVNVEADGDVVEVELASVAAELDSRIVNEGGEVTVRFLGGDARVDAVSKFGRVDSNLKNVPLGKDESSAQGVSGGGSTRAVIVKASGDVHLIGPDLGGSAGQNP